MTASLEHRGPDSSGRYSSAHVNLGVTRLRIVDPLGSEQPLRNTDGTLALIANAEIYNAGELRRMLSSAGHRFHTGGDCEVILHLYEEYGDDLVHHLRGMFAFALWDETRGRLLLARDRLGEKPLYVYNAPGMLLFASELKSLLSSGKVPLAFEPDQVDRYFHYQYVPEPGTLLKDVRKLAAGHLLTVETAPWRVTERRYWHLEDAAVLDGDPAEVIGAELHALAPLIVRTDVPVGVALSGGLDSSVVAALAVKYADQPVHAFTVGFSGRPGNDERDQASSLAASLGMPYHEIEIGTAQVVADFPALVRSWDEPIADMTGFCYRAVARAAHDTGVRVLLQGQGGDELFWGYPWVRQALSDSLLRAGLWRPGPPALTGYLREARRGTVLGAARKLAADLRAPRGRVVFYDLDPDFRRAMRRMDAYYGDAVRSSRSKQPAMELFTLRPPDGPVDPQRLPVEFTRLIVETYLTANGIAQGDRLAMASSVELRLPLVDYRLVEAVVGLRKTRSDADGPPKDWLRQATRDLLPDHVLSRPKRPFSPPLSAWHAALVSAYGSLLPGGMLIRHGVLTEAAARSLARARLRPGEGSTLTFKALVLEAWCRLVSGEPVASAAGS